MGNRQWLIFAGLFAFGCLLNAIQDEGIAPQGQRVDYNYIDDFRRFEDTVFVLKNEHKLYIEKGDTVKAISMLSKLGDLYSINAQYSLAYEQFWNALLLADKIQDSLSLSIIYDGIGWLYGFYKRKQEAINYFYQSINIRKKLVNSGEIGADYLISGYYGIAVFYREIQELELSKSYIDSCYAVYHALNSDNKDESFLRAEYAFYLVNIKEYSKALKILHSIDDWFKMNRPSYLVILYSFIGDAYFGLRDFENSESSYLKALEYASIYMSHVNYLPDIHNKLSMLYMQTGNYRKAYESLITSKELNERLFDSRSANNRPLLEITDEFRKEKEIRKNLIQSQRLEQLEQKKKISLLTNLIYLGTILFLIITGYFIIRNIRIRHRTEKELEWRSKELEHEKNRELLKLKNKELASSALRLIEKDKLLIELKEKLFNKKGNSDIIELKKLFRSISINYNQNWEEFEARFLEVNDTFYKKLKNSFPSLTPGDLKMCALIKLNFTSKEMANLLGIGTESVHTLRYRIRKKIGLQRTDNLTEYLSNIDA